jgi:hypothetical protein
MSLVYTHDDTTISLFILISETRKSDALRNFLFRDVDGDFFRTTHDTIFPTSSHLFFGTSSLTIR